MGAVLSSILIRRVYKCTQQTGSRVAGVARRADVRALEWKAMPYWHRALAAELSGRRAPRGPLWLAPGGSAPSPDVFQSSRIPSSSELIDYSFLHYGSFIMVNYITKNSTAKLCFCLL